MGRTRYGRTSPAIVVAALALVAALAGTALAGTDATTSAINKKKVKKIATKQINKLAPELSVASAESANTANTANTATTANTALNANAVSGVKVRRVSFVVPDDTGPTLIYNGGGLRLRAHCTGDRPHVIATTTVNNALLRSYSVDVASETIENSVEEDDLDVGESAEDLLAEDSLDQSGHMRYATNAGSVVTLEWVSDDSLAFGSGGPECAFTGHAMQSG